MKCRQPGCTGTILDGYCDVCGMPPAPGSPAPTGTSTGGRQAPRATGLCRQPGCRGTILDGYCDVCGSPEVAAIPSGAGPEQPSTLTRASSSLGSTALGSARASSFGSVVRRRPRRQRRVARLGAGLTTVPPAPAIDPSRAVLVDPVVPPERRLCPTCGTLVGQATETGEGRSEGFCPNCRAPYSFTAKLAPADLVAGQYRVEGALAHGGMGWIYLARDTNVSGRWVVLKGLLNTGDADALAATITEQQFLARVEHPLIVEIYNFVTHDDAGYIVMEFVGGRSLKQLLKQRRTANGDRPNPLPLDQALAMLIEILPAFSHLHDLDLLYCDFKPDNVIQVGDSLKLIDLGGVRHLDDQDSPIYGTIGFQAPEVATRGPSIASDLYTIGRTLMVLCADVPGYQSTYEHTLPPIEELPLIAAHDSAYRLLVRCCAPDPADRFVSADDLRQQMLGVLREVVAAGAGGNAVTVVASTLFDSPATTGETYGWDLLPRLRPDPEDPQAGWLARINTEDVRGRLEALDKAPATTAEVLLARSYAALAAGDSRLLQHCVQQLLREDPWEWRAIWLAGLAALAAKDYPTAQASFNAVYGQVPGELAPKLALALACERGGEPDLAASLYEVCAATDAAYVTPAAFGLARVHTGAGDLNAALAALGRVPTTSRGYPEAQRQRIAAVVATANSPDELGAALDLVAEGRLDAEVRAGYEQALLEKSLALVGHQQVAVAGHRLGAAELRGLLESAVRRRAVLSEDLTVKAGLVDRANSLRPWSLL